MSPGRTDADIVEVELAVPSMVCDGCAEAVHTALMALPGVRGVKVSLWRKRIRVRYEPAVLQDKMIRQAIVAAGFPIGNV